MYVYIYVCMYVCIYMYVCMYVCICMYNNNKIIGHYNYNWIKMGRNNRYI